MISKFRYIFIVVCYLLLVATVAYAMPNDAGLQTAIRKLRTMKQHTGYSRNEIERCLTPHMTTIVEHWHRMPHIYRQEFQPLFQRPDKPGPYGSMQGLPLTFRTIHFRFHYTITGPDAVPTEDISPMNGVPDYIDVCADAYERAYHIEIDMMGFKKPLDDFFMPDNGGDEKYDVYFFSGPWGGFTMPEWPDRVLSTAATYTFYFGMNSRLYDFYGKSEGKRYIEVTAPHEFLHSIQFAYNLFMPRWFMESSSTWIESVVYDGGREYDGDDINDPDEIGETDAYNDYLHLLRYWFLHPDWSLDVFNGIHEYGDVIWSLYLTQRFGTDIIRQVYENSTEGSYREMGNFWDVMFNNGTTLPEAFKTFTVWNYFTHDRDDGKHYFNGHRMPPVTIHLDDMHSEYPVRKHFDSQEMPEHFSCRYVVFNATPGVNQTLAIKVDGSDITSDSELDRLNGVGLRGWGAKLIIEQSDGDTQVDEIFTFHRSQEGQKTFSDFGTKIRKITLILINLHPDLQHETDSIVYAAGEPPKGTLSTPAVAQKEDGKVVVRWELLDISGIKDVAIIRKRYAPSEMDSDNTNFRLSEVLRASDKNGNGIPEGNINIVGVVSATDTQFEDTTIFDDIDISILDDATAVRYYYAVVPVNELGIMGTPSIAANGITPVLPPWLNQGQTIEINAMPPAASPIMLLPNYPNPFNAETWIPYKLFQPAHIVVHIYTTNGTHVQSLNLGYKPAGIYINADTAAYWDGTNTARENVASGLYYYVITDGQHQATRKMFLVK